MPSQPLSFGFAALLTLALAGAHAQAQTAAPAAQPAPADQPAQGQPAQGQPPQGQPQNPNAPVRIDMQTVPKTEWTKVCSKPQAGQKDLCFTTRDFTTAPDQPPPVALAIYDVKGDDTRVIRVLMPIGLLLKPGVHLAVDKGAVQEGAFQFCMPNGCFAETRIKGPVLDQMKKGKQLNIVAKGLANNEVTFVLPLAGFGPAFDGPAIPPEVIAKQQQEMQAELQKQLEARAQAQRQQLEKSAAPAAGAPAATPPAAAAPKP